MKQTITLEKPDDVNQELEIAARSLRKTSDEVRALRQSLAGKPAREREEIIRHALAEAGILRDRNPDRINLENYKEFVPIEVSGKPVSETIIEERR